MAVYDPTDPRHVSALANAVGVGPLVWLAEPDPDNRYQTLLICRYRDGSEHRMATVSRSARDMRRFVAAVSDAILAAVVSGVG